MAINIIMTENHAKELLAELVKAKKAALTAVGIRAVSDVAALAPVDTGRLQNSITYRLRDENSVVIGSNVEYAPYQELGTSRNRAHPYLRPGLTQNQETYKQIVEKYLSGKA